MPVIEKINAFHYRLWSRIPADMLTYLSRHSRVSTVVFCITLFSGLTAAAQTTILQPLADKPVPGSAVKLKSDFYVPVTPETVRWGYLPDNAAKPVVTVSSGATVTFDTLSHEGILEDQGRDPAKYFGGFGVAPDQVLNDAKAIAASSLVHDFAKDGPHVVMGPVALENAQPGDVLKVEMISLTPRVPYGVISNRHGKGALPGEFPENAGPQAGAGAASPQLYSNVSKFVPTKLIDGKWYGSGQRSAFSHRAIHGDHGRHAERERQAKFHPAGRLRRQHGYPLPGRGSHAVSAGAGSGRNVLYCRSALCPGQRRGGADRGGRFVADHSAFYRAKGRRSGDSRQAHRPICRNGGVLDCHRTRS